MLRLLILIECDLCKEMLTSVPDPSSQLEVSWTEEIYRAEYEAEQCGWNIHRSKHICYDCITVISHSFLPKSGHDLLRAC
jgi:hypothetical protein